MTDYVRFLRWVAAYHDRFHTISHSNKFLKLIKNLSSWEAIRAEPKPSVHHLDGNPPISNLAWAAVLHKKHKNTVSWAESFLQDEMS